ncbi:unnamed protein product [Caenorhabditis brenneri]
MTTIQVFSLFQRRARQIVGGDSVEDRSLSNSTISSSVSSCDCDHCRSSSEDEEVGGTVDVAVQTDNQDELPFDEEAEQLRLRMEELAMEQMGPEQQERIDHNMAFVSRLLRRQ